MDVMADNLKGIPLSSPDEGLDIPTSAKMLVKREIELLDGTSIPLHDIYVVWFSYTLGNWKALVSTSLPDGKYYEVTHSKERDVTFVDTYLKINNTKLSKDTNNA